jgi:hypothetical protein
MSLPPSPGRDDVFTTPSHLRAYAIASALRTVGIDIAAAATPEAARRLLSTDWLRVLEERLEASGVLEPGELDARMDRPDQPWVVH